MMSRFIAAMDHSGGSTGGVLDRYHQEYTEDNKMALVHEMRMRMVSSDDFNSDNIWAAILYKDTVDRGMVSYLKNKDIYSFLKIDSGCNEDGTLKQFPVEQMLEFAKQQGCIGTKMRSIIKNSKYMDEVLDQQFAIAKTILTYGLIPIVEPEIEINDRDKIVHEYRLRDKLYDLLDSVNGQIILKLTLPDEPNFYKRVSEHSSVYKLVGLSGGYSTHEACERLSVQQGMIASFSRALSEGLYANLNDNEFNEVMSWNIENIVKASST